MTYLDPAIVTYVMSLSPAVCLSHVTLGFPSRLPSSAYVSGGYKKDRAELSPTCADREKQGYGFESPVRGRSPGSSGDVCWGRLTLGPGVNENRKDEEADYPERRCQRPWIQSTERLRELYRGGEDCRDQRPCQAEDPEHTAKHVLPTARPALRRESALPGPIVNCESLRAGARALLPDHALLQLLEPKVATEALRAFRHAASKREQAEKVA